MRGKDTKSIITENFALPFWHISPFGNIFVFNFNVKINTMKEEQELNSPSEVLSENSDELLHDIDNELIEGELTEESPEKDKKEKKSFFGKKVTKEDRLKGELEKLYKEKNELNDKFLRIYSEFENYKKRTNKEKLDLITTASEKVILGLLPIIDDFERAIQANQNTENVEAVKEGFELIYNKIKGLFKQFEVEEIAAAGEPFDTDFHEAITYFPATSEEDKGKVFDVTQKGYKIKNKVIRFAKVVIAN